MKIFSPVRKTLASFAILVASLALAGGGKSGAKSDGWPAQNERFIQIAEDRLQQQRALDLSALPEPKAGGTDFVNVTQVIRGQSEISVDNIFAKFRERLKNGDFVRDEQSGAWKLAHNGGESSLPKHDPIFVVKGPQGLVVLDGHHDLYLALFLGARTIPVEVVEDLSHLSPLEFWTEAKKRNLVYLSETPAELAKNPPDTAVIRDNPNRYLAALVALKVKFKKREIKQLKGAANPVWLKVNDSIPFIEFHIARVLTEAGIFYDPKWGDKVPDEVSERIREALLRARTQDSVLSQIPVWDYDEATQYKKDGKSEAERFLKRWTPAAGCGAIFQLG